MARAGRKRDINARWRKTTRAERRAPADHGTPEFVAKRAFLVGSSNVRDERAGDPLGILLINGLITENHHKAGWSFALSFWRVFGKPIPPTSQLEAYGVRAPGWVGDSPDDEIIERQYDTCRLALKGAGRLTWQEVCSIAAEHRLPSWFMRQRCGQRRRPSDVRHCEALVIGLDTLAGVLITGKRRAA